MCCQHSVNTHIFKKPSGFFFLSAASKSLISQSNNFIFIKILETYYFAPLFTYTSHTIKYQGISAANVVAENNHILPVSWTVSDSILEEKDTVYNHFQKRCFSWVCTLLPGLEQYVLQKFLLNILNHSCKLLKHY